MASLDEIGLKYGTDKASNAHNFLINYEYFFKELRDESFTLIEIGGFTGASLKMWNEYFQRARIVCLDIDPKVKSFEGERIHVEIGDSSAESVLNGLITKFGQPKLLLDDGSHRWDHQRIAFKTLFRHVEPGGWYIIEDLHTSFEPKFAGQDDIAFFEIVAKLASYLQLRGPRKVEFEAVNNPDLVAIAKDIEFITFISRSCIIKKKGAPS